MPRWLWPNPGHRSWPGEYLLKGGSMKMRAAIITAIFGYALVARCQTIDWAKNFQDVVANDRAANDRARDEMFNEILPKLLKEDPSLAAAEVPGLVEQLNRKEDKIRLQASAIILVLAQFRSDSATVLARAIPALMNHVQDSVPRIRTNSLNALCTLRPDIPHEELQFLIQLAEGQDDQLASRALFGLARMADSHVDAANAIEAALLRGSPNRKLSAIRALPAAGRPIPQQLVSRLGDLLIEDNTQIVSAALEAIGRLGLSAIRLNLIQLNQLAETSADVRLADAARQLIARQYSPH